jgi:acetolactate synthase-1/3 small subunit
MQHTLVALVEDKPGVLNRVSSLFRRRAFNIESLTVGHTAEPGISRITIVVDSDDLSVERLTAYLYKLVNVIQVHDLTTQPTVSRDLAMIKVYATPEPVLTSCNCGRFREALWMCQQLFHHPVTGDEAKIEGLHGRFRSSKFAASWRWRAAPLLTK